MELTGEGGGEGKTGGGGWHFPNSKSALTLGTMFSEWLLPLFFPFPVTQQEHTALPHQHKQTQHGES